MEKSGTFHESEWQPTIMKREEKRTWDRLLTNSNIQHRGETAKGNAEVAREVEENPRVSLKPDIGREMGSRVSVVKNRVKWQCY